MIAAINTKKNICDSLSAVPLSPGNCPPPFGFFLKAQKQIELNNPQKQINKATDDDRQRRQAFCHIKPPATKEKRKIAEFVI